jgi:hypothetical protein
LVKGYVAQVEELLRQAGIASAKIQEFATRLPTEEEAKKAQTARAELIASAAEPQDPSEREGKLWPIGHKLKIHFLDGTKDQHKKVETIVSE